MVCFRASTKPSAEEQSHPSRRVTLSGVVRENLQAARGGEDTRAGVKTCKLRHTSVGFMVSSVLQQLINYSLHGYDLYFCGGMTAIKVSIRCIFMLHFLRFVYASNLTSAENVINK